MPKAPPSRPAAAALRRSGSATSSSPGAPRVRRGYFECRYGQLHVHNAIPAGGGFEEGTSLLCLHRSPHSGRAFVPFLAVAGRGRSVFAPDLPGFGDSDPPPPPAGVIQHSAAIGDFLDAMRLRQIDVVGHGFGALVAAELAATRPAQVRRLVLVSPPLAAEAAAPHPVIPAADGSHLLEEWRRAVAECGPAVPAEGVTAALAERLRNGAQAAAAAAAQRAYPLLPRLSTLTAQLLVLRLRDDLRTQARPAPGVPARARLIDLPAHDSSIFGTAPEAAAQALESFLR